MFNFLIDIVWRQPLWLLLALQPLLLWLALRWLQNRTQQQFADKHLLPWVKVQQNKSIWQRLFSRDTAYLFAWIGFALALAGPRVPDNNVDPSKTKLDVMLVMDLSRSMYATDIKPSRLRRAVLEAYEFLSLAKSMRAGVVVYAARPHLYVPLTSDKSALEFYLKDLDTLQLPTQGSDHASALKFAQKALDLSKSASKSIVWFTDGDISDNQLKSLEAVIQHASIKTYALGIASSGGVAIPLANGTWLKSKGQGVITISQLGKLSKRLKSGGGVYSIVKDDESDWQAIYQQGILKNILPDQESHSEQWKELFAWFLFPAFALLFFALFPSLKAALVLIVLSSIIAFSTASAEESYLDKLLEGASGYEAEEYYQAKAVFIQAVLKADSENDRAIALHNLGNSLFQIGDYATATILFSDALRHNPEQKQSTHNQKLSYELYKTLQRRQRNQQAQGNLGKSNQNSLVFDFPEKLPTAANARAVDTTEYKLPAMPKDDLNRLLNKGLAHIKLLEAQGIKTKLKRKQKQKLDEARLQLIGLEEQGSSSSNPLWKRLFEIEEGFPGSLDDPEEIPGVLPW